jgi:RNA polymerase sigma-70 factor, ECF subfamily
VSRAADDDLVARGRGAWPQLGVAERAFRTYVAERVGADVDPASIHAEDLYLACGCALGDPAAIAAFDAGYRDQLRGFVARVDAPAVVRDEACQAVMRDLLVAEPGRPPRIAIYTGRGPLGAFLRVVAVREAVRLARAAGPAAPGDAALERVADRDDPELHYLRALYGGAFKEAFAAALADLSLHDRALLGRHLVDGASIDVLAVDHEVHRATVARWIARARDRLVDGTTRRLARRLGIGHDEVASVLRLVESNVDLSARRLLRIR